MGILFDLLLIVTLAAWVVGLGIGGQLSVEIAAVVLLVLVVLIALARSQRMDSVHLVFRIGVPLASLAALIVMYAEGDMGSTIAIFTLFLTLVVVLFGFYLMFRGAFPPKK